MASHKKKNWEIFSKPIVFATVGLFAIIGTVVAYITYQAIISQPKPEPTTPIEIPAGIHDPNTVRESKTYQETTQNLKTTVKLGSDFIPSEDGLTYMMLTLEGLEPEDVEFNVRTPLNLALVLDRSGSMSGDKLQNVKNALVAISDVLTPEDRITLVTYSDNVTVEYSTEKFDKEQFLSKVNGLSSSGSTYLEGGLRKGLEAVLENTSSEYVNRTILLSDGLANQGVSDPTTLATIVQNLTDGQIVVSTIGVGTDYDENLMSAVAIAGNGNYYFMEDSSKAEEIFAQEFDNISKLVAQNIEIKFNMNEDFYAPIEIGEYNSPTESHSNSMNELTNFAINDIYAEKISTFLFKINSPKKLSEKIIDFVEITIEYKDSFSKQTETITIPITATIVNSEVNVLADNIVYETYFDLYLAQGMWEVHQQLDEHQNYEADKSVVKLIEELETANIRMDGEYDETLKELREKQDFIYGLNDDYVNESTGGQIFQKSNQSESYQILFNR